MELPNADGGGGPAGVKDPAEEGGGPAGVVEGFAPYEKMLLDLLSGVEGGLEEKGTWKAITLSSAVEHSQAWLIFVSKELQGGWRSNFFGRLSPS